MFERPNRQSIRWRGYDYRATGYYFITICTVERIPLFGSIEDQTVELNELGRIVEHEWMRSALIRREITHDSFIAMPNHLHGIVALIDGDEKSATTNCAMPSGGRTPCAPTRPSRSIGSFVAGFKSAATRRVNAVRGLPGAPVWQRNYYEHVVRDVDDLARIRVYIATNPETWQLDAEHPEGTRNSGPEPGNSAPARRAFRESDIGDVGAHGVRPLSRTDHL